MSTKLLVIGAAVALAGACGTAPDASTAGAGTPAEYQLVATIPVGGEGGWDYLSEDTAAHRLYVSHATAVYVIDMQQNTVVGQIDSLPGVHGFAIAHDLNRGFASDGRANEVAIVDLSSLEVLSRVGTGENPDGIIYLPDVKEVWAFNGRGHSATVIGAESGDVIATIPLSGKPEFAVYDSGGRPRLQQHRGPERDRGHLRRQSRSRRQLADRPRRGRVRDSPLTSSTTDCSRCARTR